MRPFVDSTELLEDPTALRARFADDGYVLIRSLVDRDALRSVRTGVCEVLAEHGWIRPGDSTLRAQVAPCVEGEERYFAVYDDLQRLESFHALPHDPSVRRAPVALLGDSAFPHPLGIARLVFPDNEAWTTPPHQDYPNNQGTEDLYACWMPLTECPTERGSLAVLAGSHRLGLVPLEFSLGAGNRRARLDERHEHLEWCTGDLEPGDALLFHSLTVHRSLPNRSAGMRLSVDYRYQQEGDVLTAGCLQPHFDRVSWDEIYEGWERTELCRYWRDKHYVVGQWDASLHELPPEHVTDAVRTWLKWRRDHPRPGHRSRRGLFLGGLGQ